MRIRTLAASVGAALLLAAPLALAGAAPAAAGTVPGQVWFQSIGRASADATCAPSSAADLAAGWTHWVPSWAQWPNNGKGGWTCDRQITWTGSGWSAECGNYHVGGALYSVLFADGPSAAANVGPAYVGYGCSGNRATPSTITVPGVYAPGGQAQAEALCREYFGMSNIRPSLTNYSAGEFAWFCQ